VAFNGYLFVEGGAGNPQEVGSIDSVFTDPESFGKTGPTLCAGYLNSLTCAIAYDRVYFRNRWRLMCFDLRKSVSELDADTAGACVEYLFGEDENVATQAAAALRNVRPEARPVADAAFARCMTDGRPHLLKLGIEAALVRRDPQAAVVTRALAEAAQRGDARQYVAVLSAIPVGHHRRDDILAEALPRELASESKAIVDACVAYVSSATVATMADSARRPVRAALLRLLRRPGGLTNADLVQAVLAFQPTPAELETPLLQAVDDALSAAEYGRAAELLAAVLHGSPVVNTGKFLPHAMRAVASGHDSAVVAGTRLVRQHGVDQLDQRQTRECVSTLIALLSKKSGGRREAVTLLGELGAAARPAIPVLRNVFLEDDMQELVTETVKIIDPDAKLIVVDFDLDLDLEL
jgi:hypothetical protein